MPRSTNGNGVDCRGGLFVHCPMSLYQGTQTRPPFVTNLVVIVVTVVRYKWSSFPSNQRAMTALNFSTFDVDFLFQSRDSGAYHWAIPSIAEIVNTTLHMHTNDLIKSTNLGDDIIPVFHHIIIISVMYLFKINFAKVNLVLSV